MSVLLLQFIKKHEPLINVINVTVINHALDELSMMSKSHQ